MNSSVNQISMTLSNRQQKQYRCLCIVLQAVNETCKTRNGIRYTSGDTCSDASLTDYQKFLCKLAQICDNEKGSACITALVALKGPLGPEYLFVSNSRKTSELERTKVFLFDLIEYVGSNPERLAPKALQKQILGRIFEFNFPRLVVYLKQLCAALEGCISCCQNAQDTERLDTLNALRLLQDRAQFPRDMTSSSNAKQRFLRNCEDLIKAIQNSKAGEIDNIIDRHIRDDEPQSSFYWSQLRHYLGRLHSFRQASEIIFNASEKWNSLFKNFSVEYIRSSRLQKFCHPRPSYSSPNDIVEAAFPEHDLSHYETDIQELREHGLDKEIQKQEQEMPSKAQVHCEVKMHHHLVKNDKTRPCDFWNGVMFIATSKPTCRLCHYYFQDDENDFQVQPPHMNLYPRWRLPDVEGPEDKAGIRRHQELMDDILEHMQNDTLKILQRKFPQWKRNDSRTDSRTWPSGTRDGADSRTPPPQHHMYPSPVTDGESFVMEMEYDDCRGVAVSI
ncbi:hypothetical protein FSARC_11335 [Fusarium sarcochroum]|uniref:Uncharacterized protein n=1 Tax=Fusarium sarcochroum TaxID=1208366 RepID=A0A8H4TG68_9HYPO|nr:hypothetical protein FSARC_11335 [Fusarium sarcochroum]